MKARTIIVVVLLLVLGGLFLTGNAESHVCYPETRVGVRSQNFTPEIEKTTPQNIDYISLEQFLTDNFTSSTLVIQKEFDSTHLAYFGARYYDPTSGRFTSVDPIPGSLDLPPFFNAYAYCYNNPHSYYDPDGESPVSVIAKQAAKVGIKKAIKEYAEKQIKKRLKKELSPREFGDLCLELADLLDTLDSSWWEIGIELIPVAGDIYGGSKFALQVNKAFSKLHALEKKYVSKVTKKVPNPYGKAGSPRHQAYVEDEIRFMRNKYANNPDIKVETEVWVVGKDGQVRYIDAQAKDIRTDEIVDQVQVGRTTKSGDPVSRERRNMEDIDRATGFDTRFRPYDR